MRLITTFLGILLAIAVVLFAVSNRAPVTVEIWPLPYRFELGLYAAILLGALAGFAAGAIGAWLMGGAKRRALRLARKRIKDLEHSLAQARAQQPAAAPDKPSAAKAA
ncbi:MAG: lipopolysaccharide assembly protein LapA domain-containing protein [Rhodospirillaceae bacterium]|nr:lipopolysaccharide assembly protein LapA domain-containing protein [Rhodospirillaceae bacterium]